MSTPTLTRYEVDLHVNGYLVTLTRFAPDAVALIVGVQEVCRREWPSTADDVVIVDYREVAAS
jgi:hypothetical protein